jgi:hypothetical protein
VTFEFLSYARAKAWVKASEQAHTKALCQKASHAKIGVAPCAFASTVRLRETALAERLRQGIRSIARSAAAARDEFDFAW